METLPALLDRVYEDHAAQAALLFGDRWLSFEEVARLASGIHVILANLGANSGDRVMVVLNNSAIARLVDHAVLGFGLVRVAVSPKLHAHEIADIAVDAQAAVICCPTERSEEIQAALNTRSSPAKIATFDQTEQDLVTIARVAPSTPQRAAPCTDIAMLMYSSGTTGKAKGVVVTHESWIAQIRQALSNLPPITNQDVVVLAAPMAHFGGSVALDCVMQGARTIMLEPFDRTRVVDTIAQHQATIVPLVPTLLESLLDEVEARPSAVASIRCIPYGGSPASVSMLRKAVRYFPGALTQFYGLAEALAPLTVLSSTDHDRAVNADSRSGTLTAESDILQSVGRWVPEVEHREDGGSISVRGKVVMGGYWNNDKLTASVLRDGWFETGDVGRTDENGYLHIVGRKSDLIISGGFNIYPREVEQVIEGIVGIVEVAVVGIPDRRWGEGVHACVVLDPLSTYAHPNEGKERLIVAIREACLGAIASYKKPVGVHIFGALPRNNFGKIDRVSLRSLLVAANSDRQIEKEQ